MSGRGPETPELEFELNLGVAVSLGGLMNHEIWKSQNPFLASRTLSWRVVLRIGNHRS